MNARSQSPVRLRIGSLAVAVALCGCAPNLVVRNPEVTWNDATKTASAEVANVGRGRAGEFLVYFDAEENPASQNHRPQVVRRVPGLAAGSSTTLSADFAPLAHPDNASLRNVYQIEIIADPKNEVAESREDDNVATVPVSAVACSPAESDVTSGTSGSMMQGQSYNETRAVRVTLLASSPRIVEKLVLKGLNVPNSSDSARVGARIYEDASQGLIGSGSATVASGMNQTVEVPVVATLQPGATYRIGFYVETNPPSQGSGNFFIPSGFTDLQNETPYSESTGLFRVNSAHAVASDSFPTNPNLAVPQMTIVTACP